MRFLVFAVFAALLSGGVLFFSPFLPVSAQSGLTLVFDDPGTSGNWQDKWFLDGSGSVSYTTNGMVLDASPGSGEAVLWAKPIVRGDVRIEYDYTHLDNDADPYVVILFIQASGAGNRAADISTWSRPVASYPLYHTEMSNYSITYDVNSGNTTKMMRARHNPGQTLAGEHSYSNLWERNQTYHMTIQKSGRNFSMTARNISTGASRTFNFTGSASKTAITEGRIGLRHMDDRVSRYKNFKIWADEYVSGGGNVTGGSTGGGSAGGTLCNLYQGGQTPPTGYGAAWNTARSDKPLFLNSYCKTNAVDLRVGHGTGEQNHYVYKQGYVYTGGAWQPKTFSGNFVQGSTDWLLGDGAHTHNNPPSVTTYWVGYLCQWTGSQWKCGCRDAACATNYWQLQAFTMTSGSGGTTGGTTGGSVSSNSCLSTFSGQVTTLNQNYGYNTKKVATWPNNARYDARGGKWESHMNGDYHVNPGNRKNTAPLQFGIDWGTNVDGAGRIDRFMSSNNMPEQSTPLCFYGGLVVGTQPLNATWGETKYNGGGYAFSLNAKNSIVEGMRVHNHHDAFVPYRSNGFIYRGNWVSYNRDDCVENDARAGGTITDNLFDGCFVFYSNTGGGINAGGVHNTVRITNNLIRMQPMPGPPFGGAGLEGNRNNVKYGVFFKFGQDDVDAGKVAKIVLRDNIIALESDGVGNAMANLKHMTECANNRILWLGSGSFPYASSIPSKFQSCFTVVTGTAAKNEWQQKKQQWIDAHPNITRI